MDEENKALDAFLAAQSKVHELLGIEEGERLHDLRGRPWVIATRPDDPKAHRSDLYFVADDGHTDCAFAPGLERRDVGLLVVIRNGNAEAPHVYVCLASEEATPALAQASWNTWLAAEQEADARVGPGDPHDIP